MCSQKSRR